MSAIAAMVACCTGTKKSPAWTGLNQASLLRASQRRVANQWLDRLSRVPPALCVPAQELYIGRAFSRIRTVATRHCAPLYIISAGLGFVPGRTEVPSYDLTLSDDAASSVRDQIIGTVDASQWWEAVRSGPFSVDPQTLRRRPGRILISLSRPYAVMVGDWLMSWDASLRRRLRIFGSDLARVLPAPLADQCVRYDARLDTIAPGIRYEFASRALAHFADVIAATPISDASHDQRIVDATLAGVCAPKVIRRTRLADDHLVPLIKKVMADNSTAAAALGALRRQYGVACSEDRFERLSTQVKA